jgi:hypothetical protein
MLSSSRIPFLLNRMSRSLQIHTPHEGIYEKKCKLSEEHHLPLEMITHTQLKGEGKMYMEKSWK